jgi:hypothetical protein
LLQFKFSLAARPENVTMKSRLSIGDAASYATFQLAVFVITRIDKQFPVFGFANISIARVRGCLRIVGVRKWA